MKKVSLHHTIYIRIAIIIFISWFLITFFSGFVARIAVNNFADEPLFKKNLTIYAAFIAADIESGETRSKIDWYRASCGIETAVFEKGVPLFSTIVDVDSAELYSRVRGGIIQNTGRESHRGSGFIRRTDSNFVLHRNPFFFRQKLFYYLDRGERLYVFTHIKHEIPMHRFLIMIAVAAALVFIITLFFFRKMLRPLYVLYEGMQKVAGGEIEHKVTVKSRDEFGMLASAFNEMNASLVKMMRAKERIMLDISHEFKSPLARIMLALEVDDIEKLRESVRGDTMHLSEMITALLDRYRSSANIALNPETVQLSQLVKGVVIREDGAGNRIKFEYDDSKVVCDVQRAVILVKNIIENALFYSQKEVRVKIESSESAANYNTDGRAAGAAHCVIFSVRDFGGGISAEDLPYVFEPFYRADRSRTSATGGTGLGLFICRSIADAHGWKINIESKSGSGTLVRVVIPSAAGNNLIKEQ